MNDYGIRKVYYTTDNGTISCEKVQNMNQTNVSSGMRASIKNMNKQNVCKILGTNMYNKIKHNK